MTTQIVKDDARGVGWNTYISPGVVGSIGGVNQQIRFKQSNPDMPMRYDPLSSQEHEKKFGSNVQDGMTTSYDDGGGPSRLEDTKWYGNRDTKTDVGWIHQDIRATDRTIQPTLSETPDFSWTNRLATLYRERHVNPNFLPLPGGYALPRGEIPANGGGPVLTNVVQPLGYPTNGPTESGAQYTNLEQYQGDERRETRLKNAAYLRERYLIGKGPQTYRKISGR